MSVRAFSLLAGMAGVCCLGGMTLNSYAQVCGGSCTVQNCNGNGSVCCRPIGPDIIVGGISTTTDQFPSLSNFAAETVGNVRYDAFSMGTTSCNVGNANAVWQAFSSNRHPAISQNLFKYKVVNGVGRFEQIGQSWLKHGFTALTQNQCCSCNGAGGSVLGVGCSDPYNSSRNAGQGSLGPKWQVDATSGYFPPGGPANPGWSGTTARRLKIKGSDLEPSNGSTIRYFGECQYIAQDDAAAGNKNNNASYREMNVTQSGVDPNFEWSFSALSSTQREKPGIQAWKDIDPAVTLTNVVTSESPNPLAFNPACCTSALVIVGAKATDLGGGMWHYEYAVENLNSDRSIASFSVPVSASAIVTNIGFHDVDYHSNDGIGNVTRDGTDWASTRNSTELRWDGVPWSTNPNANALRWGTLYNFRFDSNSPPTTGMATLGTFLVVGTVSANTVIPTPVIPPACPPDINGDNQVNVNDLLAVINAWGACGAPCPPDINGDGQVNVNDLLAVINAWGPCPTDGKSGR